MKTLKHLPSWLPRMFDASELPCYAAYELGDKYQIALINILACKANEVAHKRGYYPSSLLDKITDVANVVLHPYGLKCNDNTAIEICECLEGVEWRDVVTCGGKYELPEDNR